MIPQQLFICSQFPANISHLTQTFPSGCYLCRCQYVIDTNEVTLRSSRLCLRRRVNQKLLMDSTRCRYGSLCGEEQRKRADICSRNTRIDLCVTEPTAAWLTSNTIKWKREETEDYHYINQQPFPRLPLSIICAHDLMSLARSETNFFVNITIISSWLMPAPSHHVTQTLRLQSKHKSISVGRGLFNKGFPCINLAHSKWMKFLTAKTTSYVLVSFELESINL